MVSLCIWVVVVYIVLVQMVSFRYPSPQAYLSLGGKAKVRVWDFQATEVVLTVLKLFDLVSGALAKYHDNSNSVDQGLQYC